MRILILTNAYLPDIGGVQWSVARLSSRFAGRGHDVCIVTEWKETFDASVPEREESGRIRIRRMRVPKRRPVTRLLIWNWFRRNSDLIRDADIVHFFDHGTLLHWFLPFRFLHPFKKYVITHCGFDSYPIRRRHRILRRLAGRLSHARIHVGSYIAEFYGSSCDYCYVGAPIHEGNELPRAPERGVFGFIGRLEPDTGIDLCAEALGRLAERRRETMTLILCGDGSLRGGTLAADSARLRVIHSGATDRVREVCARAETIFASSYLAMFDAMAMGRLLITCVSNDLKERYIEAIPGLRDCAFVVRSAGELDDALEAALGKGEARARKLEAAERLIASLSWDRIADEHLALYSRLLETPR